MKKLLLTLIVSLVFGGSIFAEQVETPWGPFNLNDYMYNDYEVVFVQINGNYVDAESNWENLEIGAFVNGVIRGHGTMAYYPDDGDPYPIFEFAVYYDNTGEEISFKLYDHSTNTDYPDCDITLVTGEDHMELYDDYAEAVVLNFTGGGETSTFTKEIVGYGEGNNYWYFIASPIVEDVTPSAENGFFAAEEYDLFFFDQAQPEAEWQGYDANSFVIENGKGYLYASKTNTTLTFTGTPNAGDDGYAEVELTYTEGAAFAGWNLVGNPFAFEATADRPFYRLEPETGAYLECVEEDVIPMMEGIFVEYDDAYPTMSFFEAIEVGGNPVTKLVINVNQGRGICNRAIVRFDGKAAMSKFQPNPNSTQVYIPVDGKDYGVVSAPEMGEMPVNFKAGSNGTYSMLFNANEVSFNYLHLIDNMTGADVDLLENPSYSFEATTSDYASRFKLVFATGNTTDDSFAFFSNGNFIISNDGEAILQVIDVTGRILNSETINGSASVNVNAAPGVYMLRLINGDNVKVQKVVVK
jgi:hypothetical protein